MGRQPLPTPRPGSSAADGEEYVAVRLLQDGERYKVMLDVLQEDDLGSASSSEMSIDDFTDIREMLNAADLRDEARACVWVFFCSLGMRGGRGFGGRRRER